MARITYQRRKRLKKSTFAVPKGTKARRARGPKGGEQPRGSYPIPDRSHARAALAMSHGARSGKAASQSVHSAVHRKVRGKYPELAREHMTEHHGGRKVLR